MKEKSMSSLFKKFKNKKITPISLPPFPLNSENSQYEQKHTDFINSLTNSEYNLFSFIVIQDIPPSQKAFDDSSYFKRELVPKISLLDQEVNNKLFKQNNRNNDIVDETLKKRGIKRENPNYFKEMDKEFDKIKAKYRKELINEVIFDNIYYYLADQSPSDYDEETLIEKTKEIIQSETDLFKKIKKQVQTPYKEEERNRIYHHQLPPSLSEYINYYSWEQFYCLESESEIFLASGNYRGSGTRQNHGFWGHLFSELSKKIKVESSLIYFNKECKLLVADLPEFTLFNSNLRTNYKIDEKLSSKSLKNIKLIQEVKDLDWELLIFNKIII